MDVCLVLVSWKVVNFTVIQLRQCLIQAEVEIIFVHFETSKSNYLLKELISSNVLSQFRHHIHKQLVDEFKIISLALYQHGYNNFWFAVHGKRADYTCLIWGLYWLFLFRFDHFSKFYFCNDTLKSWRLINSMSWNKAMQWHFYYMQTTRDVLSCTLPLGWI